LNLCPKDDKFELPVFNRTDNIPPPIQQGAKKYGTYVGSAIGLAAVLIVVVFALFKWVMWFRKKFPEGYKKPKTVTNQPTPMEEIR
jgi:hypothetical protein